MRIYPLVLLLACVVPLSAQDKFRDDGIQLLIGSDMSGFLALPPGQGAMLSATQYHLVADLTEFDLHSWIEAGKGQLSGQIRHVGIAGFNTTGIYVAYTLPISMDTKAAGAVCMKVDRYKREFRSSPGVKFGINTSLSPQSRLAIAVSNPQNIFLANPWKREDPHLEAVFRTTTPAGPVILLRAGLRIRTGFDGKICIAYPIPGGHTLWYEAGTNPFTQGCGFILRMRRFLLSLRLGYTAGSTFHPKTDVLWAG